MVFGLALEVIVALIHPAYDSALGDWGPVICDVFVATGVLGEVLASARVTLCQGEQLRRSDERLTTAEGNAMIAFAEATSASGAAADAQQKLMIAEERSAALTDALSLATKRLTVAEETVRDAITRAAELEKEAAEARRRTAEIERLTAWRRIGWEQLKRLSDRLRPLSFGPVLYDIFIEYERGDVEAYTLAMDLLSAFNNAGLHHMRFRANSWLSHMFGAIMVASAEVDGAEVAAAISDAGLPIGVVDIDLSTHLPANVPLPNLFVFIGPRPPPPAEAPPPTMMVPITINPTDARVITDDAK